MITVRRRITWGDLDPLGIVFYPRYYEWMDEAAHQFFDALGVNLVELLKRRGIIFALVETSCRYLRPVRYHDEIELETELTELGSKTLTLSHLVRSPSGRLLAEGQEKRICIREGKGGFEAVDMPPEVLHALREGLSRSR